MKKKYYLLTAVISYLVLLIASIPAKPVTDLINENTNIYISGVSGTLWNGQAYSIDIDTHAQLRDTQWSFNLWKLFLAEIALDLSTRYHENTITTEASLSFFGRLIINNLSASIPAKQLADIASIPLVQLDGLITMNIDNAQWTPGELPVATGVINWQKAKVTVAETASLGDISITLSESEQETLSAIISNKGGEIKINGTAELIPDENYAVNLTFTPTATTKNSLKQSLEMFAKKQKNGDFLLKNSGSINQTGLL